jgi:dTDP-glucose 4,6-dehydratase
MARRFLVTGGAGFIGSALVRLILGATGDEVLVLDKLAYAGSLASLAVVRGDPRFHFVQADIRDEAALADAFAAFSPDIVVHLAAETHVDRSIDGPRPFVESNVVGTFTLLQAALGYWRGLPPGRAAGFRFHHVSTDEVYGALGPEGAFEVGDPYRPNSPYAATKAASDHLVRAWSRTYGLPVVVSLSSNTYGPWQFPEKLVPLTILNAVEAKPLTVYGSGAQVRDWLHVEDHARALLAIACRGRPGETYHVAGGDERTNLSVVQAVAAILDEVAPDPAIGRHGSLIAFVADRPGHDFRYALEAGAGIGALGWAPRVAFDLGLRRTVAWYLENRAWWEPIRRRIYGGERLGVPS